MKGEKPTNLPALLTSNDPAVQALVEVAEVHLGRRGKPLDRVVTFRDLDQYGIASVTASGDGSNSTIVVIPSGGGINTGPIAGDSDTAPDFGQNDPTQPPRPTGVRASGLTLEAIGITWNPPDYNNHAYAEIFASLSDNWEDIIQTFNSSRPIGAGNNTQYFMGTAVGTTFIHRGLESTIPAIDLERDVISISPGPGQNQFTVFLAQSAVGFVSFGENVYLISSLPWDGNGIQGTVSYINGAEVIVDGPNNFDTAIPSDTQLVHVADDDDLNQALNPQPIYYWVRFVSTAEVVGQPQSDRGVIGTVLVNPTTVLNILTGRIRRSQLANDIISPINFISGPINEVDGDGNRIYPTVRDFVDSISGDLIQEYDEILQQVFLGFIGGSTIGNGTPIDVVGYTNSFSIIHLYTAIEIPNAVPGTVVEISAPVGNVLETLNGELFTILDPGAIPVSNYGGSIAYFMEPVGPVVLPPGEDLSISGVTTFIPGMEIPGDYDGIATAAAYISQLTGEVNENGAFIEQLETLQAAFENQTVNGIFQIISTITNRQLVNATDESALAYIADTMQVDFGNDSIALNQASQYIYANDQSITNSIVFKAQQNIGGVLFSAGFGVGLESGPEQEPVSTFAVSADQFAILSSASHGRLITRISTTGSGVNRRYVIMCVAPTGNTTTQDGLLIGSRVTITVPFNAASDIQSNIRGKTFVVTARSPIAGFINITLRSEDTSEIIGFINSQDLDGGYACFPEQSVPFIVNTTVNPPVVGIRGRLIVDGMITATEIEVTDLLRANEIWAVGITAFGLIQTRSLIGETIATPRVGGWAIKIGHVDTSFDNRVFEFSRWSVVDDPIPNPDVDDIINQQAQFPQLTSQGPTDSSFWLKADGSVYIRGNLTVGGNARIWTGYTTSNTNYFLQIDDEFPIMVFPRSLAQVSGIPLSEGSSITYTDAVRNAVRSNALFWVNKNGTAGFNTANGGIFVDTNPVAPPTGYGLLTVKNRLGSNGQTLGTGRVHMTSQFSLADDSNPVGPSALVGCTIALFLVSAGVDYGGLPTTIIPSSRNGTGGVNLGSSSTFMNSHYLIIRSTTSDTGGQSDPGYRAYLEWINNYNLFSNRVYEYFGSSSEHHSPSGAIEIAAGNNYRVLTVIVERYDNEGSHVYGSTGGVVLPYSGDVFCQQVATTQYTGPTSINTIDGSGGPGFGGNEPPPRVPDGTAYV